MQLERFLTKNNLTLSNQARKIYDDGIEIMKKSLDPHHSQHHVHGLLDELDRFLRNETSADLKRINFDVLLPAISWHDAWKATLSQSGNILLMIYREFNDGPGSARMFRRYLAQNSIYDSAGKQITYAIRRHANFTFQNLGMLIEFFSPTRTIEAKILCDLDFLDAWSKRRFSHLITTYLRKPKNIRPELIRVGLWWFRNFVKLENGKALFYRYTKQQFRKRKSLIIAECNSLWKNRAKYLDLKDPRFAQFR